MANYTYFYECIGCYHVLKTTDYPYKSPCPRCGCFLRLSITEVVFSDGTVYKKKYGRVNKSMRKGV